MASVSSLDKDLRMSRNARYTPAAANEVKSWIEGVLGEKLAGSDLLDGLKDGVALCKYVFPLPHSQPSGHAPFPWPPRCYTCADSDLADW